MDDTGLAVKVVVLPIRVLHHIGCPYPVTVGPVHGHQGPVYKVLAGPYLCGAKACTTAIGSGIHIISITKLLIVGSAKYPGITGLPVPGALKAACAKAETTPIKKEVIKRMVLFILLLYC